MGIQLALQLPGAEVETCQPLTVSWTGSDATASGASFSLYITRTDAGWNGGNDLTIGQGVLGTSPFTWTHVAVNPGTYHINATSSASSLSFVPTASFEVTQGTDTSCLASFPQKLDATALVDETTTIGTPLPTSPPDVAPGYKPNLILIVAAAAGAAAVVLALIFVLWYIVRRRRRAPIPIRSRLSSSGGTQEFEKPRHYSLRSNHHLSLPRASDAMPMIPVPASPRTPMSPQFNMQRDTVASQRASLVSMDPEPALPVPSSPPPRAAPAPVATSPPSRTPYAESTAASDDSFAEERDALRDEFVISEGTTSQSGHRGQKDGRPFSTVGSSVASDTGEGLDRTRPMVPSIPKRQQVTFAVSNPDSAAWEEESAGHGDIGMAR